MNALKWGSGESSSERGEVRCKQFTVAKLEAAPTALRFAGGAVWGRWDSQPGWTVFLPRCGDVSEPLQAKAHSVHTQLAFTWHPLLRLPSQVQLFLPPETLRISSLVPQTDRGECVTEAAAARRVPVSPASRYRRSYPSDRL